mgnify:CR=1 FL=1
MATDKRKHAFWLTDEAKKMVEIDAHMDNCGSQSEFVEKAIRFYDGYVKKYQRTQLVWLVVYIYDKIW